MSELVEATGTLKITGLKTYTCDVCGARDRIAGVLVVGSLDGEKVYVLGDWELCWRCRAELGSKRLGWAAAYAQTFGRKAPWLETDDYKVPVLGTGDGNFGACVSCAVGKGEYVAVYIDGDRLVDAYLCRECLRMPGWALPWAVAELAALGRPADWVGELREAGVGSSKR